MPKSLLMTGPHTQCDITRESDNSAIASYGPQLMAEKICAKAIDLLASTPFGASEATALWSQLRPLDMAMIKMFWELADAEDKEVDLKNVHFARWNTITRRQAEVKVNV